MGTLERRERERQQRKTEILEAARKLFFTRGFRDTTIDEIARDTELARGTVYLYFSSKEEIYATVLEEGLDIANSLMAEAISSADAPMGKLLSVMDTSLRFLRDFPEYANVLMLHRMEITEQLSSELQERMHMKSERLFTRISDILREGIERGDFRPMPIAENSVLLLAMIRGFLLMQNTPHCPIDSDSMQGALHEFVRASVVARGEECKAE